jgi:hypothetical protein
VNSTLISLSIDFLFLFLNWENKYSRSTNNLLANLSLAPVDIDNLIETMLEGKSVKKNGPSTINTLL